MHIWQCREYWLPAKTILRAHYGQQVFDGGKMVFEGCSGGGRQALIQAQRFPELFDGIISRAPANAYVPQFLWYAKMAKLHAAPGGALTPGKVEAIGAAVRAKCDVLDGLKDGIISRPDMCKFDPAELACTAAETDSCLTPPQVATARGYYEPTIVDNGRFTWPGFPPGGESPGAWMLLGPKYSNFLFDGFMRYMVAQDPNVDPLTVDPEKYIGRLEYLSAAIDAVDPDLSRFKAKGGKMILWTGQADWLITAHNATAYYQSVVEYAGGQAAADEFIEYYTSPDVQHCAGGAGPDKVDLVTPMFEWLEKGIKPSSKTIIATQSRVPQGTKPVSRPLCQFPRYPKHVGGDPNSAASFSCTLPERSLAAAGPAPVASSPDANIAGTWTMNLDTPFGASTSTFTLRQSEKKVFGTYGDQPSATPVTGTVNGKEVTLMYTIDLMSLELAVTYAGTVDGDTMQGKMSISGLGEGTFTGTKN